MRSRRLTWILLSLLCLAGVCLLWQGRDARLVRPAEVPPPTAVASAQLRQATPRQAVQPYLLSTNAAKASTVMANTNKFAYRLSNTAKSLDQLMRDDRAILLENALIDSSWPLTLSIPANLRAQGDPGAYIVQARGPIDNAFRAMLKASGATIVSYIPNNAYLVRAPAGVANGLTGNPLTQSVIPYEPYYKISSSMPVTVGQKAFSSVQMETNRAAGPSLLTLAVKQAPLPVGTYLTLGLFADNAAATIQQIEKLGGQIVARDRSPFGPVVRVQPPADWVALAALPGVQIVEPYHKRVHANDLSRAAAGVSTDTLVPTNYMGLTGKNVIVEVNDSGIDETHPDLINRIIGDSALSLVDTNGHGTHVAGIIAGDGTESTNVTKASGSIMPGTAGQFRGKAQAAKLYSVAALNNNGNRDVSDQYLQEAAARTNALISNNSWNNGNSSYDLAAASYDAAVRDALPEVTGSQPVLFVFSAGNSGGGHNTGVSGTPDTILSPATAKNVITVGALEQLRNITNVVTNLDGSVSTPWQPRTDTSNQVAAYSGRGNVGIGIEGSFGRFKPDVVAPGTFVVSTRSSQWDTNAYYNPTNVTTLYYERIVDTNAPNYYALNLATTPNAVSVTIQIVPNILSPNPLNLPIYVSLVPDPNNNFPDPTNNTGPSAYFLPVPTNLVTIPPDGGLGYLAAAVASGGFNYAVGDSDTQPISYDLIQKVFTTNDLGNYYHVLQGLNDLLGTTSPHYYRYESGTSMAAADVSGVLALMQDFFTNRWQTMLPSPALLKAMLINGARQTGDYDFQVNNSINFQGWGLINLPSALQPGITNQFTVPCSAFILDQNPTNALATGDSQTFYVSVTNASAQFQPLRITLAWTDPPGNPAAAIKLVNDLNLVVTNLSDPANPIIYYGNDIGSGNTFNTRETTNTTPVFDSINNIENVYISPLNGTNFSVTVVGYRVNVNAVTAQTNNATGIYAPNVVQDYALVISSGNGSVTNAMTVTANPVVSNPTSDQQITFITATNQPLMNQFVGANTPLMGTNTLSIPLTSLSTTNALNGVTNWQVTVGMTNQWHFYVITNNAVDASGSSSDVTNAAFVTYIPNTLSIPRMGVFADSQANATRPQADIDLYVSTASGLTNLDPMVISNCVNGTQVGLSVAGAFNGASLSRGGTEFVVDTNSTPGQVYYIGVKSEDQMASEYGFIPIFSATPFSQMNPNGSQTVNGMPLPTFIPDGNSAVPGYADVFGIAIYPVDARRVVITNTFYAQRFGDLIGSVTHDSTHVILNNHADALGTRTFIYDDSGQGDITGSQVSHGPGSLNNFVGQSGAGVWILHEADNAVGFTNNVNNFTLLIEPHRDSQNGTTNTVQPNSWYYDYIDVPMGATNLTINATNLTATATLELFVKYGAKPTLTTYDTNVVLNIGALPGGSISIGLTNVPPLTVGRYFYGVYNPSSTIAQDAYLIAKIDIGTVPGQVDFNSSGPVPILDDAVTYSTIDVPDDAAISSVDVGLRVNHPRISDLVFHLISPDGTRILLMENRGGTDTNGAGATTSITNADLGIVWSDSFEGGSGTFFVSAPGYIPRGWHVDSGSVGVFTNGYTSFGGGGGSPYDGNYYVDLNGTNAGTISTNIANGSIIPGYVYELSFAYAPNPDSIANGRIPHADVLIDGQPLAAVIANFANSWENLGWQRTSFVFTATSPSIQLAFQSTTPGMGGVLLDTVSLSGLGLATNYSYLVFTENTNLTTTPIKFAPPPFAVTTATNEFFYLPEQSLDSLAGQDALGTWTLEIQDDRAGATNNATLVSWQLRFNFASFAHALTPEFLIPNPPDIIMDELTTLTVTNTATETDTNKTLIYSLSISVDTNTMTINGWPLNFAGTVPAPVISTNGIITWIPSEAQGPGVYTITTVVAVYGVPSATTNNSFTVTVNEVNVPPGFHFPTNTTVFNIYESFPFTANCVAMDLDVPANPLTFALVSGPTGLTVSTDGAINWTPTLIGTNTVKISVTDTNIFALTNSFSVTNSFTIVVTTMTNPPTGPLETARGEHTATLLPNGKVLIAGGMNAVGFLSSAELYDPATGTWTNTGSLNTARGEHTATLLPNGKVLITGGINKTSGTFLSLSSSELYDPATGTWTATTGSLTTGRYNHTATLLPNGKVLVTGGFNFASLITLSSSELYDPATGTWTPTGSMNTARKTHTATLLPNGKVLVAGGGSSSAELYDPNSGGGTWTLTGSMTDARSDGFTATLLPNGKVLVVGGAGTNGYLSSAELYDPAAGMWTNTGSMTIGRYAINATLLPNGKVLVAGGYGTGGIYLSSSELYDPNIGGGTWTVTALTLSIGRQYPTATLLPNGQVLLAGGFGSSGSLSSAELYDPNIGGGTWTATTNMLNSARAYHTATLLTNGQVLVTGGYNGGTNSELYNPVSGWTNTGSLNTARGEHTATLLPRGKVLVVGGYNSSTNSDSAELYDPASGTWTPTDPLTTARYAHTAMLLPNGKVLVVGGVGSAGELSSAELYDPAGGTWTATGSLTTGRYAHTATLLPNGKVLIAGGFNFTSGWLSSAELYDPATGTWTTTGSLTTGRYAHTATLLPNGKVLVTGGVNWSAGGYLPSAELYDPANGIWTVTGLLTTGRNAHTATLLTDGQVLIAGGINWSIGSYLSSSELYDVGLGYTNSWQPQIATVTPSLNSGDTLEITGSGFRGISEGSGGNTQDSPADHPVVQLRSMESGQTLFLLCTNWSTNSYTSVPVTNLPPGWTLVTMFVNGIPSTSSIILFGRDSIAYFSILAPAVAGGNAQLQWAAPADARFQMEWATNISQPMVWMTNENILTSSNGTFTFTDPDSTNSPTRFYRLIQLP